MKVSLQILHKNAMIPTYGSKNAAGFDLHLVEDVMVRSNQTKVLPTGLSVEIPVGYEIQIRPRSGTSLKTKLRITNSPGTIDADYRGEVGIIVENTGSEVIVLKKGDRIAQGVLTAVEQAEWYISSKLSETERGAGGFGSTGV